MKKCDCYHIETKRQYTYNPITGNPIGHDVDVGVCWGTRECDECSCGGDRTKCDFYPEFREKAMKEIEPKFGEWISVEDRLPEKFINVFCWYPSKNYGSNIVIDYMESDRGYFAHQFKYGEPTHWMSLPKPPKGE